VRFFLVLSPTALMPLFELQGHRGARGLKPENTLPSFEAAFDALVSSMETDLHLTRDGVIVLCHDPVLSTVSTSSRHEKLVVARLTLEDLRRFLALPCADPSRFPEVNPTITPVAECYATRQGIHPYAIPTLEDLFAFTAAYAGDLGLRAGKTAEQRSRAGRARFDLELKRVPFHPESIGDGFDGTRPCALEERLLDVVAQAGVVARTTVRSFDHRSVRALMDVEPRLTGAVLVADTALIDPGEVARWAGATIYCPSVNFVDSDMLRRAHAAGVRVLPWTVNDPADWQRLLDWGVDGLTTDYPDRLAEVLKARRMSW
jgi:glycerophosphoryl diester phosphodiesterase